MAYATVDQLRAYLPQVRSGADRDDLLSDVLDRATAIIDTELGYAFGTAAIGTQVVYGDGTAYLQPPAFVAGSVTAVSAPTGYSVPAYVASDGLLITVDADGAQAIGVRADRLASGLRWEPGVPYTVAATFGYSAVPADIVEATLEIAARIWRARDAGFSDVVGVEGSGAVGYNGALPNLVKRILDNYRASSGSGVW